MNAAASHALTRDAALLAQLAEALQDLFAWAKVRDDGARAAGGSPVLRQRMADLLIEHRVASAVLDEARDTPRAEAEDDDQRRLVRRCVVRCLRLATDVVGQARGEPAVAWMRDELVARRQLGTGEA